MKSFKTKKYHEVDSADDHQSFDEARYYQGDQFEVGGVDFGVNDRHMPAKLHQHGWDRPGRHSADYGVASTRQSRYQSHEPYYERGPDYRGKGPKNYQRSDDRLLEDISEALYRSHEVDAREIMVDVKDGDVYLKGQIESRLTKKLAERCVESVSGVKDIFNQLTVASPANTDNRYRDLEDLDRFRMA